MISTNQDHRPEQPFVLVEMNETDAGGPILPCPFCGTPPTSVLMKVNSAYYGYAVICQTLDCGMTGPGGTSVNSQRAAFRAAVDKWNARYQP